MRRGVPLVVTPEVGSSRDSAGAGLVVAGEPEPLSSAIRLLIADLSLARSMSDAGRRRDILLLLGPKYSNLDNEVILVAGTSRWTRMAKSIFLEAEVLMIEAQ